MKKKIYIYQSRGLYLAVIRNDSKVHLDNDNFTIVKLLPREISAGIEKKKERKERRWLSWQTHFVVGNAYISPRSFNLRKWLFRPRVSRMQIRMELIALRAPFVFPVAEGRMINSAVVIWSVTVHENGSAVLYGPGGKYLWIRRMEIPGRLQSLPFPPSRPALLLKYHYVPTVCQDHNKERRER